MGVHALSESLPETTITTAKPKRQERTRILPPYNVILENDDYHSPEFVVEAMRKALCCTEQRAIQFMTEAHTSGRAIVWTGAKEVAELKAEQIQSFHEIHADGRKLGPLGVILEPAN